MKYEHQEIVILYRLQKIASLPEFIPRRKHNNVLWNCNQKLFSKYWLILKLNNWTLDNRLWKGLSFATYCRKLKSKVVFSVWRECPIDNYYITIYISDYEQLSTSYVVNFMQWIASACTNLTFFIIQFLFIITRVNTTFVYFELILNK